MVSIISLRFQTVYIIIVNDNYVYIKQCHSQKLEHYYSAVVILLGKICGFYFRTNSMSFKI